MMMMMRMMMGGGTNVIASGRPPELPSSKAVPCHHIQTHMRTRHTQKTPMALGNTKNRQIGLMTNQPLGVWGEVRCQLVLKGTSGAQLVPSLYCNNINLSISIKVC